MRTSRTAVAIGTGVIVAVTSIALVVTAIVVDGRAADAPSTAVDAPAGTRAGAQPGGPAGPGGPADPVERLRERVTERPGDWAAWAELGFAYVQRARVTADPADYPRAEEALARSLALRPDGNPRALIASGALAAARHDFEDARAYAERALAVNAYDAAAHGVHADALIELGRYDEGFAAVQSMIDLRPDTGSYARAAYVRELRGDVVGARGDLELALAVAPTPADIGFALYHLGTLAFDSGDLDTAAARFDEGLARAPDYAPLTAGRARVRAARGDVVGAVADYRALLGRVPQPAYALELGDLLTATGDTAGAAEQYGLVRAAQDLAAANGVSVDLELALFDADAGRGTAAVAAATTARAGRPSIFADDALAWSLHAAGRSAEALPHARAALRLGTRSAMLHYHLGMIAEAAGDLPLAREQLGTALALNPHFSPLHAPRARAARERLG